MKQEFSICASSHAKPDFDWHMIPKVDGRDIEGRAMYSYSSHRPSKIATYYETLSGRVCQRKLTFNKIVSSLSRLVLTCRIALKMALGSTPKPQLSLVPLSSFLREVRIERVLVFTCLSPPLQLSTQLMRS